MNLLNEQLRLTQIELQDIGKKILKEDNPIKLKMLQNKQARLRVVQKQLLADLGD